LFLGTALHTGIEKGVEAAVNEYFMQYPVITDAHINEAMKLEVMIPKAKAKIPDGEFEVKIDHEDFVGFIDLLAPVTSGTRLGGEYQELPGVYDMYDFKYSNNTSKYQNSVQLHLYKYFFEKTNPGKKIRNLFYLCVPKVNIKQKKTETLGQFRQRIQEELKTAEPNLVQVEYDQNKVLDWMFNVKHTIEAVDFPKNQSWLCRYCEYADYCIKGVDFMLLPKNERRNIETVEKKVVWLYGSPFTGKTTFANKFPDPLMLNTDGNIKFVDAPYIGIKDKIEVTGRMTKKTFAWEIFKDVVSELEKKNNDFKSIVVDLLEDLYEYCRLYMYDQLGITHESDESFSAWDKVRTEFLSTLKRLMALDYENIILISHEDTTKDITKKGGDKLTSIKPNLPDKVATKVAGMVDIVARIVADGNVRTLSFKTNEVIFGGGRLTANTNEISLDYDEFLEVYDEANKNAVESMKNGSKSSSTSGSRTSRGKKSSVEEKPSESENQAVSDDVEQETTPEVVLEDPKTFDILADEAEPVETTEAEPVAPATRTRRTRARRTEN
jgi:phage nucleotide-binding protein